MGTTLTHERPTLIQAVRPRAVCCPVLVGRTAEAEQLLTALAGVGRGQGRTVLLAGEAGIGKSRLTREIAEQARRQGCAVLTGRAVPGGVPTPFRPFAEALAAALRGRELPADSDLRPFLPALGRLLPQLRTDRIAVDDSLVFVGEAVLRLLRVLYGTQGCVLVLEDLHWADREALALLEYLADNAGHERLMCIATFRDDQPGGAADLAVKLAARGSADIVALGRLDAEATARMTEACLNAKRLPGNVLSLVTDRAEGVPFLVEEVLARLLADGALVQADGLWNITGAAAAPVPATFADEVSRRLDAADHATRLVVRAASVLGRRFDWSLLSAITGLDDGEVAKALRASVELQLIVPGDGGGFRFRHALTHEAVQAGLLPPERALLSGLALASVETAKPGLPGGWCMLAADLAEGVGDAPRAAELLLEAGRRSLAVGALASAEQTLSRARTLADMGPADLRYAVDEALTTVFAASGQVDRAIETGRSVLASIGQADPARSAELHLQIARAALASGRWADADASVERARSLSPDMAQLDVCAAQVAVARGDLAQARRLAEAALRSAETSRIPEVECEALEVIGRVARQQDPAEAERAYARSAAVASAHGLRMAHLRAVAELGTVEVIRKGSLDRLRQARELATEHGALFLTACLDLQIIGPLIKDFRGDEALAMASACTELSRRFRLITLPEALLWEASAYAVRGERGPMEERIAEAAEVAVAEDAGDIAGCAWGRCRATLSLLDEDLERAWAEMQTGADLLVGSPTAPAPPFLGLWPLIGAVLGRDAAEASARLRAAHFPRHKMIGDMLGYTDAILAGQAGRTADAEAAFAAVDSQIGPLDQWYRQYARRIAAQAALADGWGNPVSWLREAAAFFELRGHDRIAAACRRLLREAGAPVPRRRPGDEAVPEPLRLAGITGREADVLGLVAEGLTNREIGGRMFLSPRTVEKHVASLLIKSGLRRRAQLGGYHAVLDG